MAHDHLKTLLVGGMVLLTGCAGGITGSPDTTTVESTTTESNAVEATKTESSASDTGQGGTSPTTDGGTVAFYISDEKNVIGNFRHLNVTITRVGFARTTANGSGWVEREVDNATVDLTELQGANATLIDAYDVPNGNYTKVFVYVSDVNATLKDGKQTRVKLPSKKLQLNSDFTVTNDSEVDFVFDISVHQAGQSGKYVLRPTIGESGTDVQIEPTGNATARRSNKTRRQSNETGKQS